MQTLFQGWPLLRAMNAIVQKLMSIRVSSAKVGAATIRLARLATEEYIQNRLLLPKYSDPRHLAHFESKCYSQSGEDGVIAEIFRRVGIGSHRFLELGVGANSENNTSYLLAQGWRGTWIDCIPVDQIREGAGIDHHLDSGLLIYQSVILSAKTIGPILEGHASEGETDLLSLDLDRSTYEVWKAMECLRPRVLVIEYNAFFPPPTRWIMRPGLDPLDSTTMCFGASLSSFCDLARNRGYQLVHCGLTGVNAFFVRNDLLNDKFQQADEEFFYEPYRSFLLYDHELSRWA